MIPAFLLLALAASALLVAAGYLLGMNAGLRSARPAAYVEAAPPLDPADPAASWNLGALRKELDEALAAALPVSDADADRLERLERLEATVQGLQPLLTRERLVVERPPPGHEGSARGALPAFLDRIASAGGFTTVVIGDESGLPLAANQTLDEVDAIAATTSLLLWLSDRIVSTGRAAPIAMVVRDETNRLAVHRVFRVGDERYVLTAMSTRAVLPPDALDPALDTIERLIATPFIDD